jgi:hypothetical protein
VVHLWHTIGPSQTDQAEEARKRRITGCSAAIQGLFLQEALPAGKPRMAEHYRRVMLKNYKAMSNISSGRPLLENKHPGLLPALRDYVLQNGGN